MTLIPIFKKRTLDELTKTHSLDYTTPTWTAIYLPKDNDIIQLEAQRYNLSYFDPNYQRELNLYLYMNESLTEVYALDEVVLNVDTNDCYPIYDTPLADLLLNLQN